jgi:hypothetical protein
VVTANAVKLHGLFLYALPKLYGIESLLWNCLAVGAFQEKTDLCAAGRSALLTVLVEKNRVPVPRDPFRFADDKFIRNGLSAMRALEHLADYFGDAGTISRSTDFDGLRNWGVQEHRNFHFIAGELSKKRIDIRQAATRW